LLGKKKEVVTKLLEAGADLSATGSLGSCADLLRSSIDFSQIAAKCLSFLLVLLSLFLHFSFLPFTFVSSTVPKVEEVHSKEEASNQIFDALCKGDAHQLRALCSRFSSYSEIPPPPTFSIDGQSWLHLASYEGNVSVVRVLSPLRDSPLNLKSKLGRTPLHEAALMGHWEIITDLVKAGANPSIKASTPDTNLALHYACQRKLPR
jgi:ankyrin repeat protein